MPTYKKNTRGKIILGIDPGYADTGYGVISITKGALNYIACDTITTSSKDPFPERLLVLSTSIDTIIKEFNPSVLALEKIFFGKNLKTAVNVAQARGLIVMATAKYHIPLVEFTPLEVKQSLTSYGQATKDQVAHMVKVLLKLKTLSKKDDAIDALAIAICASFRGRSLV